MISLEDCYECIVFDASYMVLPLGIVLQSEFPMLGNTKDIRNFRK
jgi:hypothetical protein